MSSVTFHLLPNFKAANTHICGHLVVSLLVRQKPPTLKTFNNCTECTSMKLSEYKYINILAVKEQDRKTLLS